MAALRGWNTDELYYITNLVCIQLVIELTEVIIRAAENAGPGVSLGGSEELLPITAFMDDLTLLNPSTKAVKLILEKLELLPGGGILTLKRVICMSGGQDPLFHAPQWFHKTPFQHISVSQDPLLNQISQNFRIFC